MPRPRCLCLLLRTEALLTPILLRTQQAVGATAWPGTGSAGKSPPLQGGQTLFLEDCPALYGSLFSALCETGLDQLVCGK